MSISASVGRGGTNVTADVRRIQTALNIYRALVGLSPIQLDGRVGPETIDAIQAFQKEATSIADGRIDPRGPTLRALSAAISGPVESDVRQGAMRVARDLQQELRSRALQLPPGLDDQLREVLARVESLRGTASPPTAQLAIAFPPRAGWRVQRAMAAAVAVPVAAAALIEAAVLTLLAMIAILVIIQLAPAASRALEDLMRKVQVLMARLIDEVEEAIKGIEDLLTRNPQARMRCSGAVIAFREASASLMRALTEPRPTDELGRKRLERLLLDLMTKWQAAMQALLDCMTGNGAI